MRSFLLPLVCFSWQIVKVKKANISVGEISLREEGYGNLSFGRVEILF